MKIIGCEKRTLRIRTISLSIAAILWLFTGRVSPAAESGDVLGEVDGEVITGKAVESGLAVDLTDLQQRIYELKRRKLDELIGEALLRQEAERRKVPLQKLLDDEVKSKTGQTTDKEVENFYRENEAKLKGDEKTLADKIRGYLQSKKFDTRRDQFVQELRSQHRVSVYLKPPTPMRVIIPGRNGPSKGPADAPVTIVEFSDFQCPFCRQAVSVIKRVLGAHPNEVKLIFRNFPLENIHPQARTAAEAAECASDQGRFWDYHDRLFGEADLSLPNLKGMAQKLGLDLSAFERCLSEGKSRSVVAADFENGVSVGVVATPTFFINGRPLLGAQPFENFEAVIAEELSALKAKRQ